MFVYVGWYPSAFTHDYLSPHLHPPPSHHQSVSAGWDEAEGSGNEGSGDADDWTDDDDIAKGTAQAQVVGSKVEEAEPEDADDEDEGDDGYGW